MEHQRKFVYANTGAVGCVLQLPCCLPCSFAYSCWEMKESMQLQQAWKKLVQDEQQKYAPYGVQITVAQEVRGGIEKAGHTDQDLTRYKVNVGLKFNMAAAADVSPPIQGEMNRT